jgi:hypothetical protein
MYDNMLQEKQKSNPPLDVSSATAARVLGWRTEDLLGTLKFYHAINIWIEYETRQKSVKKKKEKETNLKFFVR